MSLGVRTVPQAGYAVVRADLERDRDEILDAWRRNGLHPGREEEILRWHYRENPAGPGRCWLLVERREDRVVGTAGLGLRRVRLAGSPALAAVASDFAVDREHRTAQPALLLQRAVREDLPPGVAWVYGTPNHRAAGIFARVGYRKVGRLASYSRVLRVEPFLSRLSRLPGATHRLAFVANGALRLAAPETWLRPRGLVLRPLARFDERFDDLWRRAAEGRAVIGERDARFLTWRYRECRSRLYAAVGLLAEGEATLRGYAVYFLEAHRARVVDFLAEPGCDAALLAGLLRYLRRSAASASFELSGTPALEGLLRRFRFVPRGEGPAVVACPARPELAAWYFLLGDEDYH